MTNPQKWLRRFSKFTVFSTLFLIFLGALVKSHEVGLSVPDWPTTYGYNMFTFPLNDMVGGIFYEHSHRLFASFVGMLTIILAGWIRFVEKRKWVKKLGYLALGLVILQGIFGGITVLFFLPTMISMMHGIIAQSFLLILILIAFSLSAEYLRTNKIENTKNLVKVIRWSQVTFIIIFIQLILGAWVRHINAGLAIPDFPTVGWSWIPKINEYTLQKINDWRFEHDLPIITLFSIWVHFLHRIWAVAVLLSVFIFGYHYFKGKKVYNFTMIGLQVGVLVQILLGGLTIWSGKSPIIASLHVVNGAILLGLSFLMLLRYLPNIFSLERVKIET